MVWKTQADGKRAGRAVIDTRGLNQITQTDAYPISLQEDIIAKVKDCSYISVVNCTSFFYQWRVHADDQDKLTIVSHRGQETSNVALMGAKNSISYVQRHINRINSKAIQAFCERLHRRCGYTFQVTGRSPLSPSGTFNLFHHNISLNLFFCFLQ